MGSSALGPSSMLLAAALLVAASCRPVHLVAPPSPAPGGAPQLRAPKGSPGESSPFPGGVRLGRFTLEGDERLVQADTRRAFEEAFGRHLAMAFPARDARRAPISVDLRYRVHLHRESSTALDVLSTLTLGLLFFTPERGLALVEADLTIRGEAPRTLRLTVLAPWNSSFTPWFSREAKQRRLDHAHEVAFRRIVARLREWGEAAGPAGQEARSTWAQPHLPPSPRWYQVTPTLHGVGLYADEQRSPSLTLQREVVRAQEQTGALGTLLELLGGVSVGYSYGSAWVSSRVRDESGRLSEIASGRGRHHGAGFALSAPPRSSGLYFYPAVGFLWQQITIADVSGVAKQAEEEHATNIPAIATDPTTGAPVDLGAAWGYQLTMTSLYLGPRLGFTLVAGAKTAFYLSLEGGMNLVEWRWHRVRWEGYRGSEHRFAAAESFSGRAVVGLVHRPWHAGLQCIVGAEYFRSFRYPDEIPFRGQVVYDAGLAAYQRPVRWARAAELTTLGVHCGLVAFY